MFRTATTDLSFTNGFDPTGEYSARGFNLYAPLLRAVAFYRQVRATGYLRAGAELLAASA